MRLVGSVSALPKDGESWIAPEGKIWVCPACGRAKKDREWMGDTSCVMHAVLCYDDATLVRDASGRVTAAKAVEETEGPIGGANGTEG